MKTEATIIPIAAGKGGVGKTFLTANLAMALADLGHRTIAVDLDLGGSNLHSFLGLPNRYPGIGDFLKARSAELEDLLVETHSNNLFFLPGDGKTPFMANIAYAQKMKLISRIRKLQAEYVLLDLGAGSSFNTLDFYGLSPHGLLVTTPEPPAVMGMLVFLKNYLLRAIKRRVARNHAVHNLIEEMTKQPMEDQMGTMDALQNQIVLEDPEAGKIVEEICGNSRPRIVFNAGEHPEEINLSHQISKSLQNILHIEADYFGFVFRDSAVRKAVQDRQAFLPNYRENATASDITRIAERIVKFWDRPISDSAGLLYNSMVQSRGSSHISSAAA